MQYRVLNKIKVEGRALLSNYQYFQSLQPACQVAPVLKANAYGHGLVPVAKFIETHLPPIPFVCVDSLYEAYELYKTGVKLDIFIMGYTDPTNYAVWKQLPFIFSVWDPDTLRSLDRHQPGARVHLKLDTGMHRLGLTRKTTPAFLKTLKQCASLRVEGVYSHLAQADDPLGKTFTHHQLREFLGRVGELENFGLRFTWKHLQATAGASVLTHPDLNLIRLGLGFYGYSPFPPRSKEGRQQRQRLQPALTLVSHITHLSQLEPGDSVGYGGTYYAKQHETIATLPLGYHEGIPRGLSNRAVFTLKNGAAAPLIGRVNMNMCTIKIPRTTKVGVGDPVTVISPKPTRPNSVYQLANLLKEITYPVLTDLHPSIRREIV